MLSVLFSKYRKNEISFLQLVAEVQSFLIDIGGEVKVEGFTITKTSMLHTNEMIFIIHNEFGMLGCCTSYEDIIHFFVGRYRNKI